MKSLIRYLMFVLTCAAQQAFAAGIVHIADGDCTALTAAAGAQPGQEPALIMLARKGQYVGCSLNISGDIKIDGAGASLFLIGGSTVGTFPSQISVAGGARLAMRNVNLGFLALGIPPPPKNKQAPGPKFCCIVTEPPIANSGNLTLDSVSIHGTQFASVASFLSVGFFHNSGNLILRNVSVVDNFYNGGEPALLTNSGSADISHSTFISTAHGYAPALLASTGTGTITIGNSIIVNNGSSPAPNCATGSGHIVSRGGNIVSDASCGFSAQNDRVAADPRLLDFGTHGGVVGNAALNYDSPAIGNGVVANCEATDARGLARGQAACDSGAYEVGGGDGKLSATGMSGLYYNSANNGHYISIQRLAGDLALVIWNTFDQNGAPAWLYGVGTVSGNQIHVEQVAQNVGGILHAGGGVSGATPTLWGTFDINLSDCYNASLSYNSALPQFGSGSASLQRLAFLDGVNCAR